MKHTGYSEIPHARHGPLYMTCELLKIPHEIPHARHGPLYMTCELLKLPECN